MKQILNYVICTLAIFVGVVFVFSGNFIGLAWCVLLYMWGVACPRWWRRFWLTNARILAYFNCL